VDDLPEWASMGREMSESYDALKEKYKEAEGDHPSSPVIIRPNPVEKSTPEREGEGWKYYIRKNGKFVESARVAGLQDSTVHGTGGAPDTVYHRPMKSPPIPKKDIKRH